MHTWTVDTDTARQRGDADTPAHAWHAAHTAAAGLVRAGHLEPLTLTVDGQHSTIRPADSGDEAADIAATLELIDAGRGDVVAAHMSAAERESQS